jgi:hypothetical protein
MTTGNPIVGTVTSLPVRKGKGVPDTFKGDYRDIDMFLDHFEALCAERNVTGDADKCKGLLRYCLRDVREALEALKSYSDKKYSDLRKDFIYFYDQERESQRYRLKDLQELVRKWKDKRIEDLETFKKYHLKYQRIGGWLLKHKRLGESEHRRWFWAGLHKRFRKKVEAKMTQENPQLDDSEPFAIEAIVKATKKLYNRDRFDDLEILMSYANGKSKGSSSSESDSESDESESDTNASDASDESSESEDERDRKTRRKSTEGKKGLKKGKKTSNTSKKAPEETKKGKATSNDERRQEQEIEELVTKLGKLDINEPKYLALWIRTIRRMPEVEPYLRRPAMHASSGTVAVSTESAGRQPPPHLNRNVVDREQDRPPRGYGLRCFGCGEMGHTAGRCQEVDKYIQQGAVERNSYGKLQWKDGTSIRRDDNETLIDAIKRGTKKTHLAFATREEDDSSNDKYLYLETRREESDADSDDQEDMWLNATSANVREADSFGAQRTQKVSQYEKPHEKTKDLRLGADRARKPFANAPREERFVRAEQGPIKKDVTNQGNRFGVEREQKVPFDVRKNIVDVNDEDQFVPMVVEEIRGDPEREEERKPISGQHFLCHICGSHDHP